MFKRTAEEEEKSWDILVDVEEEALEFTADVWVLPNSTLGSDRHLRRSATVPAAQGYIEMAGKHGILVFNRTEEEEEESWTILVADGGVGLKIWRSVWFLSAQGQGQGQGQGLWSRGDLCHVEQRCVMLQKAAECGSSNNVTTTATR